MITNGNGEEKRQSFEVFTSKKVRIAFNLNGIDKQINLDRKIQDFLELSMLLYKTKPLGPNFYMVFAA